MRRRSFAPGLRPATTPSVLQSLPPQLRGSVTLHWPADGVMLRSEISPLQRMQPKALPMIRRSSTRLRLLCAAAAWLACSTANAYFVRPYVQLGQGVIDGLEQDGATERTEGFTAALRAEVSLDQGTSRNFLQVTGPGAFAQSAGTMGDRLHVVNAQNTTLGFSFAFDGMIVSPARDPNLNSTMQIGVVANLRVFDASAGATYANFASKAGALVSDSVFLQFNNPTEPLSVQLQRTLAGSFAVASASPLDLDVFASLSIFAAPNDNPGTVTMDFMNTGTFRVQAAPGVSFTSDSGVFLSQQAPIPEPGSWALMALGLLGVGGAARRMRALSTIS